MDKDSFLSEYRQKRGYMREFVKIMADYDIEFEQALGALADVAYRDDRSLSSREKELALIAVLTACGATSEHLERHYEKAISMGIDVKEIVEALELVVVPGGVVKFERAILALSQWLQAQ